MSEYKLVPKSTVDELAQFIRQVDGNNRMGAGSLADKICERFRVDEPAVQGEPVGEAGSLHGAKGFTYAVFESRKVPEGTKLYTAPHPAEQEQEHEVRAMVGLLANGEWAGTHPQTDLGAALECQITKLVDRRATPDVAGLVEALESIMGYIPLDVVHCRGDKCRELWCASCFGDEEAESYLVTAARHLKNAKSALAANRKQGGGQ